MSYTKDMVFEDFNKKDSVVVVYTGEGKGKTSAGLGLMVRALGSGSRVAFIQFIKSWEVGEHKFIGDITPLYKDRLTFYKDGLGFFDAGELSSEDSKEDHIKHASDTYNFAHKVAVSGDYQLVVCDEINNAVNDGLLSLEKLAKLINDKHPNTSLCLTGRGFPDALIDKADIVTEMMKVKHHFDDKYIANKGIDY